MQIIPEMFNYGSLLSTTMYKKYSNFIRYYCKFLQISTESVVVSVKPSSFQITHKAYDYLLRICLEQCGKIKARQVFDEMPQRISQILFTCKRIHAQSLKLGFALNGELGNALLDLYAKCGNAVYTKRVFQRLEIRGVGCWNSIMSMYLRVGLVYEVVNLFWSMRNLGFWPNPFSYAIVLSACARMVLIDFGKQVHCDVIKMGYVWHSHCEGSLTDMYVKSNALGDARRLFDQVVNPSLVSWTTMITSYVMMGLLDEALKVFDSMQNQGFFPDHVAFVTVISALVNDGRLDKARDLFSQMHLPNTIAWNVMISGHAKRGFEAEAIKLFIHMRRVGVPSTRSTLGSVVSAIASLKVLDVGQSVHAQAIQQGLDHNVYVGSSLLNMYAKCQKLDSARQVFDSLDQRNIIMWNAMLGGYVQNGFAGEVIELFMDMKDDGFQVDGFTYTSILSACGCLKKMDLGSQLHSLIIKTNFETNLFVSNALVDMYAKLGSLAEARQIFDGMEIRDNVSWNAVIVGHVQVEEEDKAFDLFRRMTSEGTTADEFSLASILNACATLKNLASGRQMHCLSVKQGLATSLYAGSSLIDMYVKCGMNENAYKVFNRMRKWSVISMNALIAGLAHDSLTEALEIYKLMLAEGLCPSEITFANLLEACHAHGSFGFDFGRQIHCLLSKKGILYDDGFLGVSLLSVYMNSHQKTDAIQLFSEFPEQKSAILWTSMMSGLSQNDYHEEALQFYKEMRSYNVLPDQATFASVLKICSALTLLRDGTEIHSFAFRYGFYSDVLVGCALIDMYAKCGDVRSSMQVFNEIDCKWDIILWNSVIVGLAKNGYVEDVLKTFGELMQSNTNPDEVTFLGVLSACSHGGKICEGRRIYNTMINKYGIQPRHDHCACMIDLFGRWGLLEEAESFIEMLELEPDAKIWASFLSACKLHGDDERGRRAAEKLITLDPYNSSAYILLSSIHASSGNWSEVDSLRKKMKEQGVIKFPGSSWISKTKGIVVDDLP
ncbi:pentatricopeptide repeat-containing protein At3g09040, mitochondrial [Amaranthus tricolor]|uniref:pentatricopeptide repeat-containing protein At3g09040, mitochondrial n=1 Tax=Amaranthus tricolor TaxID=29722 RepID=UPI0025837206|nr:pentatricopeptide repeat-containing protein At3g09040, mitochondrial [Amaranthus tricolor]XP_057516830.1 pentatricopeptide repeat-containing protein At3g09040, mitochondrial [Amaranthus tricolor]XP_057516831.1 pentatricopeptide repeat-containing protein At3g09040, mitochondrial [Amaranthus tricolor]XP_057516832.1 pentatricopeptide repeat-containing protein At3g09040, mitochondrial [Amaranthus tricolor]XP_057516833.1 pentatricopeptide repeat-containing protein At3g09040, mitochondrial [Amaran